MLLATAGVVVAVGVGVILFQALGRPVVQVTSVVRSEVVQAFYATGTIVPEREYAVKSQVAGVLVLEPGIDKGVAVKRGQLLGRIVSDDLEKKLKQAEAGLKERRARADEKSSPVLNEFDRRIEAYEEIVASAKREHTRLVDLGATGNAQPVEIDRAFERARTMWAELEGFKAQRRAKALEVARELEVAEATYNIAKWNVEQQELHAPVDGVILDWPVPTRTRMKIDEHVMLIADVRPERLVMRAQVDEEDRNKLVVGQVVNMTLYSFGTEPIVGRVKTVYAKADPQRRTFEVDVELGAPQLQCRDYKVAGPEKYFKLMGDKYKAQDWNEMVVVVKGNVGHATCNGVVLEEAMKLPATGGIGLEADRGTMEYRNIRVKALN